MSALLNARRIPRADTLALKPQRDIVVGLAGRAHTGKDTAADYLVREYGFVRAAFADPIRDMLEQMLESAGIDYAWLHEPALKNRIIPELGVSARALMQTLGAEWGRTQHGADWWLKLLARRLGYGGGIGPAAPVHDRIVITDVRFPNEAAWVACLGGRVIRLQQRDQAEAVIAHESEAHIDKLHAHVTLVNNGPTLEGLHTLIDGAMGDFGIERRGGFGYPA